MIANVSRLFGVRYLTEYSHYTKGCHGCPPGLFLSAEEGSKGVRGPQNWRNDLRNLFRGTGQKNGNSFQGSNCSKIDEIRTF